MATAHVWDEEFRQRIARHQARRGPEWTNIEEERYLSHHDVKGRVVLVDCITLWLTNIFFAVNGVDQAFAEAKAELDRLTEQEATFIFVTNEIGLGGVSTDAVQRQFTDLQGLVNQYVASKSHEVVLMVSGLPLTIKHS